MSKSSISNSPDIESFIEDSYILDKSIPYTSHSTNNMHSSLIPTVSPVINPTNISTSIISGLSSFKGYCTRARGIIPLNSHG